mmetsp:Transcript_9772/g.14789  ORF Transcript_9772/g.14789 Transcript_9772/m.14789 type:complete len:88 (-) Transcript_9772:66-329(-)
MKKEKKKPPKLLFLLENSPSIFFPLPLSLLLEEETPHISCLVVLSPKFKRSFLLHLLLLLPPSRFSDTRWTHLTRMRHIRKKEEEKK